MLHYSFFEPTNDIIQRSRESKIQTVMNHIEEQVPGVKFVPVHEDSEAIIRISFNHDHPYGKTWSRVGREAERVSSDEPTMNLSDSEHEPGEIQEGSKEYGDILHELFHTLGMLHEHQHPDRKFDISVTGASSNYIIIWNLWSSQLSQRTWRMKGGLRTTSSGNSIAARLVLTHHQIWDLVWSEDLPLLYEPSLSMISDIISTANGPGMDQKSKDTTSHLMWILPGWTWCILHTMQQSSNKHCPSWWILVLARSKRTRYWNYIQTESGTECALRFWTFTTRSPSLRKKVSWASCGRSTTQDKLSNFFPGPFNLYMYSFFVSAA